MNMGSARRISVVIPCYNAEKYLRETIESILDQTHKVHEILVVDDGSTDRSRDVANSFGRAVTIIQQGNQGESVARNVGIEAASGDWVAFLDADDLWEPSKLSRQIELLDDDVVCVHTGFYYFGAKKGTAPAPDKVTGGSCTVEDLIRWPLIHISSAMVLRAVCPRFPEWTTAGEDMIFLSALSTRGRFEFVNAPLVGYRKHSQAQTTRPEHVVDHLESRIAWIEKTDLIDNPQKEVLRRLLLDDFAQTTLMAKYRRDWELFRHLRRYLLQRGDCSDHLACKQFVYPQFVYAIKDRLERAWGRSV